MKNYKTGILFGFLTLSVLFISCSVERDLAKEFVRNNKDIPVLLQITDKIILTNEKLKKIKGFDTLSVEKQDSLWFSNTLYLDSINDSNILNLIFNSMETKLKAYGFHVYSIDNIADFDTLSKRKYSFNIAQVEISEDEFVYRDEEVFFTNLIYYQDNKLNVININGWFEFSDISERKEKVFYNTATISDLLNGSFVMDQHDYSVSYKYNITPIKVDEIYLLASKSAQKYAGLFHDYLINQYIKENLPHNYSDSKYFSLDPNTGFIYNNENERFTIIEPE